MSENWEVVEMNLLSREVIGAAMAVHSALGPGLLESAYEHCLCHELALRGIPFERQKAVPVTYRGTNLECGYRLDIVVANRLILELKAVKSIQPIHEAQTITYLKLTGCKLALILNFNVVRLKQGGIKRMALNL